MKKSNKFSPEVRERAVRMVQGHRGECPSLWGAIESIVPKIGCVPQTLHEWVKRAEVDAGVREGVTTSEAQRVKELEREVAGQRDTEVGQRVFCPGGARLPFEVLRDFIDKHRDAFGVESVCKVLQIAPSGYRRHAALMREPGRRCARAHRDEILMPQIEHIWRTNMQVYGAVRVWRQLVREGTAVARCTVERLMRKLRLRGVMRGKVVRATISDAKAPCPLDRVNRQFRAERPNQLWVSDFTYVSTWQGWLYVAFVIDVFVRRIVGWRVSSSMRADFVLDALEQALYARQPERDGRLVCHSDRGSQYVRIRYTEWLAEAGIEPSWATRATAMTTRWPRPSTGSTRPS